MAKIYISSTYSDLKEYREKVYQTLRRMQHDAVAMEDYVATGQHPPLNKCLADVAKSDLYVGIFAWRYGYIPDEENPQQKSITELEYRQAQQLGKPCFIFLLHEDAPWSRRQMDVVTGKGDRGRRIEEFRQELGKTKLVSFFKTPDELANLAGAAIHQWVRNNQVEESLGQAGKELESREQGSSKYNLGTKVYGFAPEGKDNIVISGERVEGNRIVSDRSQQTYRGERIVNMGNGNYNEKIEGDYVQGNKTENQQSVTQNIGTNTGQAQAIAAGGDVNATQQMSQGEAEELTQEQIIEILAQIKQSIENAELPKEVTTQAVKYADKASEEASEEKADKAIVVRHLERATSVIKKLDTTTGAALKLVEKLKPLVLKLTGWLGVAANHFFG
ncbi:MAG: DUF4062 domain-containing protein [Prochloraceae cyanobacterium]|nr:DUF4062 domain-containing protein [Prochloraceae cyanobacterium]